MEDFLCRYVVFWTTEDYIEISYEHLNAHEDGRQETDLAPRSQHWTSLQVHMLSLSLILLFSH